MYFIIFTIGAFIGSFLNVLVDRLPKGETVFGGRSHCDKCKKDLVWHDLVPLFSFLILRGRCRYCHTQLSFYYPIIELTTGTLFVTTTLFVLNNFQLDQILNLIYYLFVVSSLIVVFFTDLKYGIIPDAVIFPAILLSVSYLFLIHNLYFLIHFLSGLGAFVFFLFLFLITRGKGMGFGDVKLSFLLGLILGFPGIVIALYIAFLTGALVGCILIIWKRKKLLGTRIPFGPFLVFGTITTLFLEKQIMQVVFHFLFPL